MQARWFACWPAAAAAIAAYEGRGQGRRGRRARRGRPAQTAPPSTESGYRLVVEMDALPHAEEDHGWTVLATTVHAERWTDAEILQAYQEQNTTVEPGLRWIKHPAAIAPVWLEKPERIAA